MSNSEGRAGWSGRSECGTNIVTVPHENIGLMAQDRELGRGGRKEKGQVALRSQFYSVVIIIIFVGPE